MPEKHLHIISFNVPYPPNYGGIIDVFYKIKSLHSIGIKIHLHCFTYGRQVPEILNKYCESVNFYKRKTGIFSALFFKPYIVESRKSDELIKVLMNDDYPILFEGLHSCYYINDKRLKNRLKIYRESNIEHTYYLNLFFVEKNFGKKIYFLIASLKLLFYQRVLKYADLMFVVSKKDTDYLKRKFLKNKIYYIPSFHQSDKVNIRLGSGEYVLYHGNLSVPENEYAAIYLITKVFNDIDIPLKIAGLDPGKRLQKLVQNYSNVELIDNPDDDKMLELIQNAQVNILVTFQSTGLKLKLLHTLFNGRHCLVNDKMLLGTGLDELCFVANNEKSLKQTALKLFVTEFKTSDIENRKKVLYETYSNIKNAQKVDTLIFG
jgi:hypothetical protein